MAQQHRFFHVDRSKALVPGQTLGLGPDGYSPFGAIHAGALQFKPHDKMTLEEVREAVAEEVRIWSFSTKPSRLRCLFAFATLEEAETFARAGEDGRDACNIIEVFSSAFVTLDMTWLRYEGDYARRLKYMGNYWSAEISNHNPAEGPRHPPSLEVLIRLPATTGRIVHGDSPVI